jgi:hypothetical protein
LLKDVGDFNLCFQLKIDAMNLILQMGGGNVTDLPSADVISATVQAILGDPPANGEKPNIGLEIIKSSTNVLQVWKKISLLINVMKI